MIYAVLGWLSMLMFAAGVVFQINALFGLSSLPSEIAAVIAREKRRALDWRRPR